MEIYDAPFGNLTILNITCLLCNKPYVITVNKDDFTDYYSNGKLIQDCFPYLTAGERELIITKICNTCFDKIYEND